MASEHDYSNGQKLRALIASFQQGTTLRNVLNQWEPRDEDSWDGLAMELQHRLVEEMTAWRKQEVAQARASQ